MVCDASHSGRRETVRATEWRGQTDGPDDTGGDDIPFLHDLDPGLRSALLGGSTTWRARAGSAIFPAAVAWTRAGLILDGIARASVASRDGRQLTVRYARAGGWIGNLYPIAGDRAPLAIHAVTDCRVLEFDVASFERIVALDPRAARLVIGVLTHRLEDLYATLAANTFGTMPERVAGHLLDLAQPGSTPGSLVVTLTQQQLADGVGTVREVVARVLREFREAGVITTSPRSIQILDAARLASLVGRWRIVNHA